MNLETNDVEYKCELTDGLEREVVAFMNARNGGVIYFGVAVPTKVVIGKLWSNHYFQNGGGKWR